MIVLSNNSLSDIKQTKENLELTNPTIKELHHLVPQENLDDAINKIYNQDCLVGLKSIPNASIDIVITDPPYFIDGMGSDWNSKELKKKTSKAEVIKSLPVGMKFDPAQGKRFQDFMSEVSNEIYRVLKPGAFFICFSQARLYHRLAVAVEDAGFEVRDMLGWVYQGQAKAFTQDHFVKKDKSLTEKEKQEIIKKLGGRKTPQLKPCIEPMVLAQKPKDGTFIENWLSYQTGLVDTSVSLDGSFPGNLMVVPKPSKKEKGDDNTHLTVKPLKLIEHLIKLFTIENQIVLDPFIGSGTHALAARNQNRNYIGFERDNEYFKIAQKRIGGNGGVE